jgi:hypothetical protein
MNVTSKSKTTIMGMIMGPPHAPGMMMWALNSKISRQSDKRYL